MPTRHETTPRPLVPGSGTARDVPPPSMHRTPFRASLAASFVLAATAVLAACENGPDVVDVPPALVATATPTTIGCTVGQSATVTFGLQNSTATAPSFTVTAQNDAIGVAVAGNTVTVTCRAPGTSAVNFTVTRGAQTQTGSVPVTVTAPVALTVTLNPGVLACAAGQRATVTASATGMQSAGAPTFAFTASNANVTVASDGPTATVTCAVPGVAAVAVTATAGVQSGSASLPVTVAVPLAATATPAAVRCTPGQSTTITLAITGGSGAPTPTYATTYAAQSAAISVTGAGDVATVVCGAAAGTSAVDYSVASGTQVVRGTVLVTIESAPPSPTLVATPSPAAIACFPGQIVPVTLTITGGAGTPEIVVTAENGNVSVPTSIAGNAVSVTCTAVGASAVTYTVSSGAQRVTGSVPVTIASAVTSIALDPPSLVLTPGASRTLTATFTLASGAPANTPQSVTWMSSDPTAATVEPQGRVTAVGAPGRSAVITATSTTNPALRASVPVTIVASTIVTGLTVSPTSATVLLGATQQITTAVSLVPNAPAGTSTGVTYTSSNPGIATVDAAGLVTANAAGTAVITVASVAAPGVSQAVGIVVSPGAPVGVLIQSLEHVDAFGNFVRIDPQNVSDRIIANLQLDPGSYLPDSIIVAVGTLRTVCQRFSAQLTRAVRDAQQTGAASFSPIQCPINTASYNATTGAVGVRNGPQTFAATVYYRAPGGSATGTRSATIRQSLTLNNTSAFVLSPVNTPTPAQIANSGNATGQAIGPTGVLWRAGTIDVKVIPVLFGNGNGIVDPVQALEVVLTDSRLPGGRVAFAAFLESDGTFTGRFAGASAASPASATLSSPLSGVTSSPNGTLVTVGSVVVAGSLTGAPRYRSGTGSLLPVGAVGSTFYVDNQSPSAITAPGQTFPASSLVNGNVPSAGAFVNGSFVFADSVRLDPTELAAAQADSAGVDRVQLTFQTSPNPATATSWVSATGTAGLAPSQTSTTYLLRTRFVDALGNATNSAASSTPFGLDVVAPTFTSISAPRDLARLMTPFSVIYNGMTDNASGIVAPSALIVTATRLAMSNNGVGGGTAPILACPLTAAQPDSSTTLTRTCPAIGVPNGVTFTQAGYYTITSRARDRANNQTSSDTRRVVLDATAPTLTLFGGSPFLMGRGQPVSFANYTAADNLDLIDSYGVLQYQNGAISLAFNGPTLGTLFDQVLTTSAFPVFTIPSFVGQVDTPDIGLNPVTGFRSFVVDAGRNIAASPLLSPLGGNVAPTPAASPAFYVGNQSSALTVNLGNGITQLSFGGNTNASTGTSAAVTFVLSGTTGTFLNPLNSVELRYLDPAINAYRPLVTLSGPTQADNGTNRTYTYTGTYAPTAAQFAQFPPGFVVLRAVGFRFNGDVIASAPVTVALVP